MSFRTPIWVLLLSLVTYVGALGQNFSGDARKIGMGGIGYSENIATKMVEDQRPYSSIVIPLGFVQMARDRKHFDPDEDDFDPILFMEYAANPLHYVLGRNPGGARGKFVKDMVNGELNRNLNAYRGFVPTHKLTAEGLASPNWGKTFKFLKRSGGAFQGIYIGAGPYLSAKTVLDIDQGLIDVLARPTEVPLASLADKHFRIGDSSAGQLALAVTGGYRGRFAFPGRSGSGFSDREGIYVGANYHYLRGFRYESADMTFRFDTEASGPDIGLLAAIPGTNPALVDNFTSHSGSGLALDFGAAAVIDRFEFAFGVNGVANRIEWKNLTGRRYQLETLVEGSDYIELGLPPGPSRLRVELPTEYIGSGAYHLDRWSFVAEAANGFQGSSFHGGVERRFGRVELRGGGRYGLDRWHPTGGIGLNLSQRVSLDVAAFGTTTNIERQMRPGLAVSIRFNRGI
jgi:hypothetical protein